ncbi:MAG: DoxX family protein [Acidimicrobiales bacterium]
MRALARPALAGYFVVSGVDAFRHPKESSEAMDPMALDLARRLGLPDDPVRLTRINGAAQAVSGVMLALGRLPRVSSAVLVATMVPSNLIGPRYWEVTEPHERARQRAQFFKNVALGGGLLLGVADTAGRPSVGWWASRAARRTAAAAMAATSATTDAAAGLAHGVSGTASGLLHGATGTSSGLGRGAVDTASGLVHGLGHGAESLGSGAAAGISGAVAALEHYAHNPKNRRRAKCWSRSARKNARRAAKVAARDLALAKHGLRVEVAQVVDAARSARAAGAARTPRFKRQARRHRREVTRAARAHLRQTRSELHKARGSAIRAKGSAEKVLAGVPHHLRAH